MKPAEPNYPNFEATGSALACRWCKFYASKPDLMCKSYLVIGLSSIINGTNDYITWSETDIEKIFADDDDELFQGFTASDTVVAATENIKTLLKK